MGKGIGMKSDKFAKFTLNCAELNRLISTGECVLKNSGAECVVKFKPGLAEDPQESRDLAAVLRELLALSKAVIKEEEEPEVAQPFLPSDEDGGEDEEDEEDEEEEEEEEEEEV
jgi:hypothetical protein